MKLFKHYSSKEELENAMRSNLSLFNRYTSLRGEWKERFVDYMTGKKTLPLTYDPFFKCLFHPVIHRSRLEQLLSSILGEKVTIQDILPSENVVLSADSLLIMDILVRLSDGSLANVEIQKFPYDFPTERMSCYSADLLLRQYTQLKLNDNFKYSDMKKVYTIILYEKSTGVFHDAALQGAYFHHGKTIFNTGLDLKLLQEYFIISLDVFRETGYAKDDDTLTIWLSLLATETISDAEYLIQKYPCLEELYIEMSGYMYRQEEVLNMFSEALKIMDRNTVRYMMDEMQKKLTDQEVELSDTKSELTNAKSQLSNKEVELTDTKSQLSNKEVELTDTKSELSDTRAQFISTIIQMTREYSGTKEQAIAKIIDKCGKTEAEAKELVEKYW